MFVLLLFIVAVAVVVKRHLRHHYNNDSNNNVNFQYSYIFDTAAYDNVCTGVVDDDDDGDVAVVTAGDDAKDC